MKKVLIVDDSALMRRVLSDIINDDEQLIVEKTANNGLEAINVLQGGCRPDILLVDINMPKMDGFTLMKKSKAINPILCFILISAYDDEANIKSGYEHGAFEFVNKPIDFLLLEDALKRIMLHVEDLRQSIKAKKGIE